MSKTASKNIEKRNKALKKHIKTCQTQTADELITGVSPAQIKQSIKENLSVYGYDTDFYVDDKSNTKLSEDQVRDLVSEALVSSLKIADKASLDSIVAHFKASKPFMIAVSVDKINSKRNNVILSVTLNGQQMQLQHEFNSRVKHLATPFLHGGTTLLRTKKKKNLDPEFQRPIRTSDDAAEAAKAAGYICENIDFKFMVQQSAHEKRETNAPGLGYGGGFWVINAVLEGTSKSAQQIQEMLSYFTTMGSLNKAVRDGKSNVLLTKRDESYDLAFNLGLASEFNEYVNRVAAENEKEVREKHIFTMDLSKYADKILNYLKSNLSKQFVQDYKTTQNEAESAVEEMFMDGSTTLLEPDTVEEADKNVEYVD